MTDHARSDNRVGIEKQHVALRKRKLYEGTVCACRKSQIFSGVDVTRPEATAHVLRLFARVIVHDQARKRVGQALEAIPQGVRRPEGHNCDMNLLWTHRDSDCPVLQLLHPRHCAVGATFRARRRSLLVVQAAEDIDHHVSRQAAPTLEVLDHLASHTTSNSLRFLSIRCKSSRLAHVLVVVPAGNDQDGGEPNRSSAAAPFDLGRFSR